MTGDHIGAANPRLGSFGGEPQRPHAPNDLAIETDKEEREKVDDQSQPSQRSTKHRDMVMGTDIPPGFQRGRLAGLGS